MKKTANILFLIGGIIAIVLALLYVIGAIVMFVIGGSQEIRALLIDSFKQSEQSYTEEQIIAAVDMLRGMLIGFGIVSLLTSACSISSAILAFKARNNNKKALFVLNIVFGILSFSLVNSVGGIFALIKGDTLFEDEFASSEPETKKEELF